ncbi:MAG TPA: hypothetical protein VGU27_05545 [Candidatus Eisenbacteria bacterium]|nr:hypothetical protein [Candidatus Eisenbacteria bacterium]
MALSRMGIVLLAVVTLPVAGYLTVRACTNAGRLTQEAKVRLDAWSGDPGDLAAAFSRLERVRWTHPYYAPAWAQRSRLERDLGYRSGYHWDDAQVLKALDCANHAIQLDPQLYDAQLAAGYAYYSYGDIHDARILARTCARLDPLNPQGALLAAQIEVWDSKWATARAYAESLIARRPPARIASQAHQCRIEACEQLGDSAAESSYLARIALEPASAWPRGNYSVFLCNRGRYEEARSWAEQALQLMDYGNAHFALARASRGLGAQVLAAANGSWREAAQDFGEATRNEPDDADSWFGLARALRAGYDSTGDAKLLEGSTRASRNALQLNPAHAGARELMQRNRTAQPRPAGS